MTAARTTLRRLLPCAALALLAGGAVAAPICSEEDSIRPRGGTLRVENDRAAGTDRNYTSGVGVMLMSHDLSGPLRAECLPAAVRLHANLIRLVNPGFWGAPDDPARTQNVVVKFGQSMYTPGDFARTDLVTDDRPYAGLLYMGLSWNRRQPDADGRGETLDTREVTLGVIGPLSLARQTQDLVHEVIGVERFRGWDHQLRNEPALQLAFDRKYRGFRGPGAIVPGWSADTIRSLGLRIGNIETSGVAGVEGRVGWNLPNDFGSYPIRPGAENRPPSADAQRARSRTRTAGPAGAHLFATLETRLVLHDFSLDGNLWRSSHSVSRRPLVLQGALGVSVHGVLAGHGVRLALMRVKRSREFDQQGPSHSYAAVALSVDL